jgi:hypothetical protein
MSFVTGSPGGVSRLSRVIAPLLREHGFTVTPYPAVADEPRELVVINPGVRSHFNPPIPALGPARGLRFALIGSCARPAAAAAWTSPAPGTCPGTRTFLDRHVSKPSAELLAVFAPNAVVVDEGQTMTGRDEIAAWLTRAATAYEYNVTVTGYEPGRVFARLEGTFPGGIADLSYRFELNDRPDHPAGNRLMSRYAVAPTVPVDGIRTGVVDGWASPA